MEMCMFRLLFLVSVSSCIHILVYFICFCLTFTWQSHRTSQSSTKLPTLRPLSSPDLPHVYWKHCLRAEANYALALMRFGNQSRRMPVSPHMEQNYATTCCCLPFSGFCADRTLWDHPSGMIASVKDMGGIWNGDFYGVNEQFPSFSERRFLSLLETNSHIY